VDLSQWHLCETGLSTFVCNKKEMLLQVSVCNLGDKAKFGDTFNVHRVSTQVSERSSSRKQYRITTIILTDSSVCTPLQSEGRHHAGVPLWAACTDTRTCYVRATVAPLWVADVPTAMTGNVTFQILAVVYTVLYVQPELYILLTLHLYVFFYLKTNSKCCMYSVHRLVF
jgi:hypothetical protein